MGLLELRTHRYKSKYQRISQHILGHGLRTHRYKSKYKLKDIPTYLKTWDYLNLRHIDTSPSIKGYPEYLDKILT